MHNRNPLSCKVLGEDGHGRCRRHAHSTPSALLRWAGPPPGVSADLPESVLATASTQTDQSELLQVTALASSVEEVRDKLLHSMFAHDVTAVFDMGRFIILLIKFTIFFTS